jgi:hypothetical protein
VFGYTPWGSYHWGATDIIKKEIKLNRNVDRLIVRITQNEENGSTDNDLLLYGFGITYRLKRAKGSEGGINYVSY